MKYVACTKTDSGLFWKHNNQWETWENNIWKCSLIALNLLRNIEKQKQTSVGICEIPPLMG